MKIQILGTGCVRCRQLTANAEKAIQGLGVAAEIEKVMEIKEILKFRILMTPGLAINGKVRSAGRVPSPEEIREMLISVLCLTLSASLALWREPRMLRSLGGRSPEMPRPAGGGLCWCMEHSWSISISTSRRRFCRIRCVSLSIAGHGGTAIFL